MLIYMFFLAKMYLDTFPFNAIENSNGLKNVE